MPQPKLNQRQPRGTWLALGLGLRFGWLWVARGGGQCHAGQNGAVGGTVQSHETPHGGTQLRPSRSGWAGAHQAWRLLRDHVTWRDVQIAQAYVMRCHARMAMRQWSEALGDVREAERLDPGERAAAAEPGWMGEGRRGGGEAGSGEKEREWE